jgi:hypothetical protein
MAALARWSNHTQINVFKKKMKLNNRNLMYRDIAIMDVLTYFNPVKEFQKRVKQTTVHVQYRNCKRNSFIQKFYVRIITSYHSCNYGFPNKYCHSPFLNDAVSWKWNAVSVDDKRNSSMEHWWNDSFRLKTEVLWSFWNNENHMPSNTVSHPKRCESSGELLWEHQKPNTFYNSH